jgi:hypothetical protein
MKTFGACINVINLVICPPSTAKEYICVICVPLGDCEFGASLLWTQGGVFWNGVLERSSVNNIWIGCSRQLNNKELHNLYSSSNVRIKRQRRLRCKCKGEWEIRTKFYAENLKGRDHWENRRILEDNIKMVLKETGCEIRSDLKCPNIRFIAELL